MRIARSALALAVAGVLAGGATLYSAEPASLQVQDFSQLSSKASPRVRYAMDRVGETLQVAVEVDALGPGLPDPKVTLGVAAARSQILKNDSPGVRVTNVREGTTRFIFDVPASQLADRDSDWDHLRLALAVRWPGGPNGTDLDCERFRCTDNRATHADLPTDAAFWAPLSLAEHRAAIAERKQAMTFQVDQPMDGRLTVVINDAAGRRVRNLISGQDYAKGTVDVTWDGLDDDGKLVAPGQYSWKAISHPGIRPVYVFDFYNHGSPPWRDGTPGSGWLSDHCNPMTAAALGDRIFLGSILSEAGNTVIELKPDGTKIADVNKPAQIGHGAAFLAVDDKYLYTLYEGYSGYANTLKELGGGKWKCLRPATLLRYDLDGRLVPFGRKASEVVLSENAYEGTDLRKGIRRSPPLPDNLAGAASLDGKLYVSMRKDNAILVLDRDSGEVVQRFTVDRPGFIAAHDGQLVLLSGESVVRFDPGTGKATPLFTPTLSAPMQYAPGNDDSGCEEKTARVATGLAIGPNGDIFISDNGVDQNVKVFDTSGKLVRQIGRQGGRPLNGPWKTDGMYQPHGIAIDGTGQLWVTETDPQPRRNSVWNASTGEFITEYLGPARYGSPGGGFDLGDASHWVGGGALWNLDITAKTAQPLATLYHPTKPGQMDNELPSNSYTFVHRDGRTFMIGQGRYTSVYELRKDNSAKLWAICGTLSGVAQFPRWTLPKGIADVPELKSLFGHDDGSGRVTGPFKDRVTVNEQLLRNYGSLMWVDRNGDDVIEPDEVEISPPTRTIIGPAWGAGEPSLDLRLLGKADNKMAAVTIAANGYLPSGAPDYHFKQSLDAAVPIANERSGTLPTGEIQAIQQDRSGRLLINASPMTGVNSSGKVEWTFPNNWIGVHGSHHAPLPERGVMQGALWFLGDAPLDDQGDVTILNGNHGRFFVMTTDGMYLDEIFQDVRVTQQRDAYHIGGEPFGGTFGRSDRDNTYYLQSGGTDYRIFRIDGLDQVKRSDGTLQVSADQIEAAARRAVRAVAAKQQGKAGTIATLPADAKLEADPSKWPGDPVAQWGDANRPFPYAQVRAVRQADQLHLAYQVRDPSPWVNNGSDWTMLFKTGDSVNFEFSTNANARPDRSEPVKGDKRLLIGPMGKENAAVLYDYRTGDPNAKPVGFASPWRAENVDRVTRLDDAKITVKRMQGGYTLTATVPLAELGLPASGDVSLKGDFGVIYGDEAGSIDLLRSYWSNQSTALVSDVPGEIAINPNMWGTLRYTQEGGR